MTKKKIMTQLNQLIKTSGLEEQEGLTLVDKFNTYEAIAKEWESKHKMIMVTDRSQTAEMAMAKAARKKFSEMRIKIEKTRKALKEQSLRKGQAIDSIAKYLTSLISPIENHLKMQEDFVKIEDEKIEMERKQKELERLEAERIAKEKAYAEEQERIRLENEKLKKEALEKEALLKKQKEEAEAKQREIDAQKKAAEEKLLEEKRRAEEEKRKLQLEQEEKLKKEREEKDKLLKQIYEQKEKERLEKEEIDRKNLAQKLEEQRVQKNIAYKNWLKECGYDPSCMRVEREGDTFTLYKKISTITL